MSTKSDRMFIVASFGKDGNLFSVQHSVHKAICKTPVDALKTTYVGMKGVGTGVSKAETIGATVFHTATHGDVLVIDLKAIHGSLCDRPD